MVRWCYLYKVIKGDLSDNLAFGKRNQGGDRPYNFLGTMQGVRTANRMDLR